MEFGDKITCVNFYNESEINLPQMKERELKQKGAEIAVTEDNKVEYVDLMVQWRLGRGIQEQSASFRKVGVYRQCNL